MNEVDLHGYKIKYDSDSGHIVHNGVEHLKGLKPEEVRDLFDNARRDSDGHSLHTFFDHTDRKDRALKIRYDGGVYRVEKGD